MVCSPRLPLLFLSLTRQFSAELNDVGGKVVDTTYFQMYAMENRDCIIISFRHCQPAVNKVQHLRIPL